MKSNFLKTAKLRIYATIGAGAEFLAKISTPIAYEAGLQTSLVVVLMIQFKDESDSIISSNKITVIKKFGDAGINETGSEILKKIEFFDGKVIANDDFLMGQKFKIKEPAKL